DGAPPPPARHTVADYRHALALLRHGDWRVPVLSCSAFRKIGIDTVWQTIGEHKALTEANGARASRRAEQARAWLWSEIRETLIDRFRAHPAVRADLARLEAEVTAGTTIPAAAAHILLGRFLDQPSKS
ncbi:protein kinase, partial [Azospirillum sp. TSO5]